MKWIIKVGSSQLTLPNQTLNETLIGDWAKQIAQLSKHSGHKFIFVTSGSIIAGIQELGINRRPNDLGMLQTLAAVGQVHLIQAYRDAFSMHKKKTAQILLTHEDFRNRQRYLNSQTTLTTLWKLGIIPIVNENDTVSTAEIQFGDNDTLAAYVSNIVSADNLLILTDQRGLYSKDPREFPDATFLDKIHLNDPLLDTYAGNKPGKFGRGGMFTKIQAARIAARSATTTIIANGGEKEVISKAVKGIPCGTHIELIKDHNLPQKKRWIMNLPSKGQLVLDLGACHAILEENKSLLPVGVTQSLGNYMRGDMVTCTDTNGKAIAYGLINYGASTMQQLMGKKSEDIRSIIGITYAKDLINRDNLATPKGHPPKPQTL